jgi:hypothetical protein
VYLFIDHDFACIVNLHFEKVDLLNDFPKSRHVDHVTLYLNTNQAQVP